MAGLKIWRWLEVVDADDSRGRLVMYHSRPILLGADFRALPINIVYRRATTYLQLAAHEVIVRNQELEPNLRNLPFRFVRVERAIRANVRFERLKGEKKQKRYKLVSTGLRKTFINM